MIHKRKHQILSINMYLMLKTLQLIVVILYRKKIRMNEVLTQGLNIIKENHDPVNEKVSISQNKRLIMKLTIRT